MITYKYYKFPNKQTVPGPMEWPDEVFYYELGTIYNNDGVYEPGGIVVQKPTPKPGWHVNVCYQGDKDLSFIQQYEIQVNTPNCIWSGQQI
jgi:hypothetical protein